MDQFEEAKLRNAKRLERIARSQPEEKVVFMQPQEQPQKEKAQPITAAVVEVTVILPNGSFQFKLVKPEVFQNANPARLTRAIVLNCVRDGLRPLLGETKEQ
jgi:hypothetical protein